MSTPPAGAPVNASVLAPASAPTGAPAGGGPASGGSSDPVFGRVVSGQGVSAEDIADVIAQAVLAVPGVTGLHGGPFGTVATYLPGRRVSGVAVRNDSTRGSAAELVEVSVVAGAERGLRTDLQALAARVRAAVAPLVEGPVSVTIADLAEPIA